MARLLNYVSNPMNRVIKVVKSNYKVVNLFCINGGTIVGKAIKLGNLMNRIIKVVKSNCKVVAMTLMSHQIHESNKVHYICGYTILYSSRSAKLLLQGSCADYQ